MQTLQIKLTREQFEAKRTEAAAKGFNITADAGEIEARGVQIGYNYSNSTSLLTVIVEHVSLADRMAGYNEQKVAGMLREMLTPEESENRPV